MSRLTIQPGDATRYEVFIAKLDGYDLAIVDLENFPESRPIIIETEEPCLNPLMIIEKMKVNCWTANILCLILESHPMFRDPTIEHVELKEDDPEVCNNISKQVREQVTKKGSRSGRKDCCRC